jgi:hypothetical protein
VHADVGTASVVVGPPQLIKHPSTATQPPRSTPALRGSARLRRALATD